jgi:hypothetical protein
MTEYFLGRWFSRWFGSAEYENFVILNVLSGECKPLQRTRAAESRNRNKRGVSEKPNE